MKRLRQSDEGVVSLIVTIILVLLISLIALSFALLMRREQKQALDRQLNTQAFYAAETGINDARKALIANPSLEVTQCSQVGTVAGTGSPVLDANGKVQYTCVLVDPSPPVLSMDVNTTDSRFVNINPDGAINQIVIDWEASDAPVGAVTYYNAMNFPPASSWSSSTPGALRVQVIQAPGNGTSLDSTQIANSTKDFFAMPSTAAGNSYTTSGQLLSGNCTASVGRHAPCRVIVPVSNGLYVLRIESLYKPNHVYIEAQDASGNALGLSGEQVLIDSTGRAQDVIRRMQVNLSAKRNYLFPDYALEVANDICKRLKIYPNASGTDAVGVAANCGNPVYPPQIPAPSPDPISPPPPTVPPTSPPTTAVTATATATPDSGDAGFGGTPCENPDGCTPNPANMWNRKFVNTTHTPPAPASCDWDFGQGTVIHTACNPGDTTPTITYPHTDIHRCTTYTVRLTNHFGGGIRDAVYTQTIKMPRGCPL